jgi:glycosyltransferase involved in cell wall biosynthesis
MASNMEPRVELYILSRDRVSLCREAVTSALAQTYKNLTVVLSDNSSTEDVVDMMYKDFPQVKVLRRRPNLPAIDHFNAIIENADEEFLVMFHDDDVFAPNYVSDMVQLAAQNCDVVAVACNAHIMRGSFLTHGKVMGGFTGQIRLNSALELIEPYFSIGPRNPAPFSGYMYQASYLKGMAMEYAKGGKHCDVSFLCELLKRGPILWTAACNFYYRIHESNDSGYEHVANRLSLMRYVQSNIGLSRRADILMDYRFTYWRRWLEQLPLNKRVGKRYAVVEKFIRARTWRLATTRIDFWIRCWYKLVRYVIR